MAGGQGVAGPLSDPEAFTRAAWGFAEEISDTLKVVTGQHSERFTALVSVEGPFDALIQQEERPGIALHRGGEKVLRLEFRAKLTTDRLKQHLKTVESKIHVFAEDGKLPLFRYEFDGAKEERPLPAAHMQFHGEHPDLARAMAGSRTRSTPKQGLGPNVCDLHFPVGGTRFRPCLEDVLEMLIVEFALLTDAERADSMTALQSGRVAWRTRQLQAAIRDNPQAAIAQLHSMGYHVRWVGEGVEPSPELDVLHRL